MTVTEFEDALRHHLNRDPFEPFVIEMDDGRVIDVAEPAVVFNTGVGGYLSPDYDLISFRSEHVRAIRSAVPGGGR